jgi:hypothetical protein
MNFQNSENVTIRGCIIRNFEGPTHEGGAGIWMSGNNYNFLIEDTKIYHNGALSNPGNENGGNVQIRMGSVSPPGNNNNITFRNCDIYESYTEDGIHIGDNVECQNFLVENCRFWGNKEDGIDIKHVTGVIIRNSTFYNHQISVTGGGVGVMIHQGARDVIVENCTTYGNRVGFSLGNQPGVIQTTGNITLRNNEIRDNEWGISAYSNLPASSVVNIYNNVIYNNSNIGINWPSTPAKSYILNNIFEQNTNYDVYFGTANPQELDYNDYTEGGTIKLTSGTYNQVEAQGEGYEIHGMSEDPFFIDEANYDFHLIAGSPCIDAGGFLTQTKEAGSDTTMVVDNANYFFDGHALVDGDTIQLESQTQKARITNIDYDNNIITFDAPLTWSSGQGVSLAYSGFAPDMGAFEFPSPEQCPDNDNDSFDSSACGGTDCNDSNPDVYPGATEICNNTLDDDCDLEIDCDDSDCLSHPSCQLEQYLLPEQYVEAEDGNLISPIQSVANSNASGGYCVSTDTSNQGYVSFTFDIQQPGQYWMQAMINSHNNDGHNSFYIGLDGEPAQGDDNYTFDTIETDVFAWDNVSLRGPSGTFEYAEFDPMVWELSQGLHTFTFYGRETNTWLDQIILRRFHHRADTNKDGCIDLSELLAFINRWKVSSKDVTMPELMEAIGLWNLGTGCMQ